MSNFLPLEDDIEDVLSKAQTGLGLRAEDLAQRTGLSKDVVKSTLRGDLDIERLKRLSEVLQLDTEKLLVRYRGEWAPQVSPPLGLVPFNTPFPIEGYEEMTVNTYLVFDPQTKLAAMFDAGGDAAPALDYIQQHALELKYIFLTHTHKDHIAALDPLLEVCPSLYANRLEPHPKAELFDEGQTWSLGKLAIQALTTPGHSPGGTSYTIAGLELPVAIVGDALFAGSMGGAPNAWLDALAVNRSKLFTLPDSTVVCPGHGPLTSIGEERAHNPFYPDL